MSGTVVRLGRDQIVDQHGGKVEVTETREVISTNPIRPMLILLPRRFPSKSLLLRLATHKVVDILRSRLFVDQLRNRLHKRVCEILLLSFFSQRGL